MLSVLPLFAVIPENHLMLQLSSCLVTHAVMPWAGHCHCSCQLQSPTFTWYGLQLIDARDHAVMIACECCTCLQSYMRQYLATGVDGPIMSPRVVFGTHAAGNMFTMTACVKPPAENCVHAPLAEVTVALAVPVAQSAGDVVRPFHTATVYVVPVHEN